MLRLSLSSEPRWLELPLGVRVLVQPLSASVMAAAQSYAQRVLREAIIARGEAIGVGAAPAGPDYDDPDVRNGRIAEELAVGLARFGIMDWEGVGDESGAPLPITPAALEAFGRSELSATFVAAYDAPLREAASEGNASAPTPNGSLAPGAATAPDASTSASSALVH